VVVRGGTLVFADHVERGDLVVTDGRIEQVGTVDAPVGARELDAAGCWVGPSFVDLHTHLREPGREAAETVESGARAAAIGGFGAIVAMPNTEPALDSAMAVGFVIERARNAVVDVAVAGAITLGREGHRLAPMAEMAAMGVRLFTDDGNGVQDAAMMRRALEYARGLGVRLAQHCEESSLAADGVMNEGSLSARLGLPGRPALSEELMVARDIDLVRLTGASLHFLHLSTARSVALVQAARAEGLPVTAEVAPHHFTLDESSCENFDPIFKVHPPLRTAVDVAALQQALRTGGVDAVATDHAPHTAELKDLAFDEAPAGMLGLEHAASLTAMVLGDDPVGLFTLLSRNPAAIAQLRRADSRPRLGAHGASLSPGEDANLVIFDPHEQYVVDRATLHSRATNTPYDGRSLTGRARHLVVNGRVVVANGQLT
jgi:dihydroorotase